MSDRIHFTAMFWALLWAPVWFANYLHPAPYSEALVLSVLLFSYLVEGVLLTLMNMKRFRWPYAGETLACWSMAVWIAWMIPAGMVLPHSESLPQWLLVHVSYAFGVSPILYIAFEYERYR
jgi:hypothetical protein